MSLSNETPKNLRLIPVKYIQENNRTNITALDQSTLNIKNNKIILTIKETGYYGIIEELSDEQIFLGKLRIADAYIKGYPNNTFRPDKPISRVEVASIFSRFTSTHQKTKQANSYMDITSNYWAFKAIDDVTQSGFFSGYPDNTFRPNQLMTRQEFVHVVSNFLTLQKDKVNYKDLPFTDTEVWAKDAIKKLYSYGAINGYGDNTFRPNQLITRAEAIVIINRVLNLPDTETATLYFNDVPLGHWAYDEIDKASKPYQYRHDLNGKLIIENLIE